MPPCCFDKQQATTRNLNGQNMTVKCYDPNDQSNHCSTFTRYVNMVQSFPNLVGQSDLTGKICASPKKIECHQNKCPQKFGSTIQFEIENVVVWWTKPIITSILCAQIHIEPQIIYQNSFNHSFLAFFYAAVIFLIINHMSQYIQSGKVVVGLVKSGRSPDRMSCKVSQTFANSDGGVSNNCLKCNFCKISGVTPWTLVIYNLQWYLIKLCISRMYSWVCRLIGITRK